MVSDLCINSSTCRYLYQHYRQHQRPFRYWYRIISITKCFTRVHLLKYKTQNLSKEQAIKKKNRNKNTIKACFTECFCRSWRCPCDVISGVPLPPPWKPQDHAEAPRTSLDVTGRLQPLTAHSLCLWTPRFWLRRGSAEPAVCAAPRDSHSLLPLLVFSLRGLGLLKTNRGR